MASNGAAEVLNTYRRSLPVSPFANPVLALIPLGHFPGRHQ